MTDAPTTEEIAAKDYWTTEDMTAANAAIAG